MESDAGGNTGSIDDKDDGGGTELMVKGDMYRL
jgi:hypothetical protein